MKSQRGREEQGSSGDAEPRGTPGKRTLTSSIQRRADGAAATGDVHAAADHGISGAGERLPFLDQIQASFGEHDVGQVQAHTDATAAEGAQAMGATAFATGNDVAFAGAPDLHTAAHEAAHVVQQRGGVQLSGGVGESGDAYERHADQVADAVVRGESAAGLLGAGGGAAGGGAVQRYEAGEHAKTGDTSAHIKKAFAPVEYVVKKGETLDAIADRFKITVDELKAANKELLQKWPAANGSGRMIEGFNEGETIGIPAKLNEMQQDAAKDPTIEVTVNGVKLDYGHLIAMGGDLFGSVDELMKATPDELRAIAKLIDEEKTSGKTVEPKRWDDATNGRFLKLAANNEVHFAPSNTDFAANSGESKGDHKSSWEDHHKKALAAARAGEKDKALIINGFGDHFLTDAFAAGHMFNKADVMDKFDDQLPTKGAGDDREFQDPAFFDAIAATVFVGDVKTEFSKYEAVETTMGIHPDIDRASRFSLLLQGVHLEKPELMSSAVAKGVHDTLNHLPAGLPVENRAGSKPWSLSGDETMNAETLAVAQEAVAKSQLQVMAAFKSKAEPDYKTLNKEVWDYTPQPTAAGKTTVKGAVDSGTDIKGSTLQTAVVTLIQKNYPLIIAELVKLGKLQKI